ARVRSWSKARKIHDDAILNDIPLIHVELMRGRGICGVGIYLYRRWNAKMNSAGDSRKSNIHTVPRFKFSFHARAHFVFSHQHKLQRFRSSDMLKHRFIHPKIEPITDIWIEAIAQSKPGHSSIAFQ